MTIKEKINKAFSPAMEIEDPERFAGRRSEVKKSIRALSSPKASFLIYGVRGVGKTSFAKQLRLMAMGNTELPSALGLIDELPKSHFPAIYFQCNDLCLDIRSMFKNIIADKDAIHSFKQYFDIPNGIEIENEKKKSFSIIYFFKRIVEAKLQGNCLSCLKGKVKKLRKSMLNRILSFSLMSYRILLLTIVGHRFLLF